MFFLLSQIFACLLVAALLGALVAWFVRRDMAQRREAAIQQGWKDQMRQIELDRDRSIHKQAAEIEKLKTPQLAVNSSSGEEGNDNLVTNLQGQVAEREDAIAELSNEVLSLRDELTDARNTSVQLETELLLKNEQDQQRDQAADDAALAELKAKIRLRDETITALHDDLAGKEQRDEDQRREQAERDKQRDSAADDVALAELKAKIRLRDETITALHDDLAGKEQRDEDQRREQAERDKQRDSAADDVALAELKAKIQLRDETITALRDELAGKEQRDEDQRREQAERDKQRDSAADDVALAELKAKIQLRDETITALRDELAGKEQRDEDQRREQDKQFRSVMDEAIGWQEKYETAAEKLAQRKTGIVVINPAATTETTNPLSEPAKGSGDEEKRERAISDRIGSVLSHPGGHKDKLQEIKGIGPVLERKLNDIGIYHFKQIAEFGADDITRVSNEMGKFASRIQRDEWVSQAQSLHRKYHQKN